MPPIITPVLALEDNFMYLVVDPATAQAAVVDPVEPEKLIAEAKAQNATITTVLCTHSHWDHGNCQFCRLEYETETVAVEMAVTPRSRSCCLRLSSTEV